MAEYECLYDLAGNPVGFRRHLWIYDLQGEPLGQRKGTHVYKLSGVYVGELEDDMILDRKLQIRDTSAPGAPQNPGSIRNPRPRDARDPGVDEVFSRLLD